MGKLVNGPRNTNKHLQFQEILRQYPELQSKFKFKANTNWHNVYAKALALGFHYDRVQKFWWFEDVKPEAPEQKITVQTKEITSVNGTGQKVHSLVLVRLICHKDILEQVTKDLVELVEVQNLEVLSVSDVMDNHDDSDFQRVYLKLRRHS